MENIKIDIENGPVTPDFDGRCRGWNARLILDPEDRSVWLHTAIGNAIPSSLWHGRTCDVSIPVDAAGEAVREILESKEAQEILDEVFASYLGEEWDGSNHVGRWEKSDPDDPYSEPKVLSSLRKLEKLLEDVPCYYGVRDWVGCEKKAVAREAREAVGDKTGKDRAAAIDAFVAGLVDDARRDGFLIDEGETWEFIEELLGDEDEDEDT